MSGKRKANTELNHENWDQEDPVIEDEEEEEVGTFKTAPKDVMEKRVIRTAKRRTQFSSGDEGKKSVFSGFGGFNKTQPSSFDFLANLTNGKTNNQEKDKNTNTTTNFFTNASATSSPVNNAFSLPTTSTSAKQTFGTITTQSSIFGGVSTGTAATPFSIKVDSTNLNKPNTNNLKNNSSPLATASVFGSTSESKPLFSLSTNSGMTFENKSKTLQTNFGNSPKSSDDKDKINSKDTQSESKSNNDKKLTYYAKLQGLNESVSDWIKKHVEETPLCILTPIFKDYERHLKEIQDEYHSPATEENKSIKSVEIQNNMVSKNITECSADKLESSLQTNKDTIDSKSTSIFAIPNKSQANIGGSFVSNVTSPGFSFGSNTSTPITSNTKSLFSLNAPNTGTNGNTPFSFGSSKPFSFSSNIQKPSESAKVENEEEDDEPPKVECTPIVEENSVYEKRCKIFVKKDGDFVDKGIGTLYIKKIEESGKHQLLVRANTSLGNVLINLILSSNIPMQRMGKNNVMMVCIPNPEAKPPPTPVLIRVKTSEEADELLETLNKFKA